VLAGARLAPIVSPVELGLILAAAVVAGVTTLFGP